MMSYPEFSGGVQEDVADFLEKMEVACISNHIVDPAQVIRLLQICLKGDARAWCRAYEEELRSSQPPVNLDLETFKQALVGAFVKQEDPDKIWQSIQSLAQGANEPINDYIRKFGLLWESLCKALGPQQLPPDMMKKDRFLTGLGESIRWKVELKRPKSFEDAVEIAKSKEWKLQRMSHLGIASSHMSAERKQVENAQGRIPIEMVHAMNPPIAPPIIPTVVVAKTIEEGLRQDT